MPLFFHEFAKHQPSCKVASDVSFKFTAKDSDVTTEVSGKYGQPNLGAKVALKLPQLKSTLSIGANGSAGAEFQKSFAAAPVTLAINKNVTVSSQKKFAKSAVAGKLALGFDGKLAGDVAASVGTDEAAVGAKVSLADSGLAGYDLGAFGKKGAFTFSALATSQLEKLSVGVSFKQSSQLTLGASASTPVKSFSPKFAVAGVYKPQKDTKIAAQVCEDFVPCFSVEKSLKEGAVKVTISKKLDQEAPLGVSAVFAL